MFGRNEMPSFGREIKKLEQIEKIEQAVLPLFDREVRGFYLDSEKKRGLSPESQRFSERQLDEAQANPKKQEMFGHVDSEPRFDKNRRIVGFVERVWLGIMYEHNDRGISFGFHPEGLDDMVFSKLAEDHDPALVEKVRKGLIALAIREELKIQEYFVETGVPIEREGFAMGRREHELRKVALQKLLKQYETK